MLEEPWLLDADSGILSTRSSLLPCAQLPVSREQTVAIIISEACSARLLGDVDLSPTWLRSVF